jgi:FKBP-type peptidyl-prolyl cis-trans isomerase FkpA
MRSTIIAAATVLASAGVTMSQDDAKKADPATAKAEAPAATPQNTGYAIGTFFARQIKQSGFKVDAAEVVKGLNDVLEGKEPRLTEEQIQMIMQAAQQEAAKGAGSRQEEMQKERVKEERKAYDKAVAGADKVAVEGRDFLEKNGKRKEVTTTASGLQYEVLKAGEGNKPAAQDTVTVHYKGTLLDGKEFDSSYKRNEPASFPLLGVIAGWTEGVQFMAPGAKYKFYIPSYLAYGAGGGAGGEIPPHSMLTFEIELLSAKK